MLQTVFLAVARHPEFQIGVAQLGPAANRAFVQRLIRNITDLLFKALPPIRKIPTMASLVDDVWAEKY